MNSRQIKVKRVFLGFLVIIFLSGVFAFAGAKELETGYPEIGGYSPQTVSTALPDYVNYVFNFGVWAGGLTAFGVLVWAGIRYLTSSGKPETKKDAKKQIFAALLGLAILLGSYLILTTINPQLVILGITGLEEVEAPPFSPIVATDYPDPLVRIKKLAQAIDRTSLELQQESEMLVAKMEKCKCSNSNSECWCQNLDCIAERSFGDPCNNKIEEIIVVNGEEIIIAPGELRKEIELSRDRVIEKIDEIVYYKNRVEAEKENLGPEIDQFIYWGVLTEEQKTQTMENLDRLISLIANISVPALSLSQVPGQCLPDPCEPHCRQDTCHHTCWRCGGCNDICRPLTPTGTPCPPFAELLQQIIQIRSEISQTCQTIVSILE